jgi:hypothetical protein
MEEDTNLTNAEYEWAFHILSHLYFELQKVDPEATLEDMEKLFHNWLARAKDAPSENS